MSGNGWVKSPGLHHEKVYGQRMEWIQWSMTGQTACQLILLPQRRGENHTPGQGRPLTTPSSPI